MRGILQHIKHGKRLFAASAAGLIIGFSLVVAPAASALTIAGPSDCDNNAIVNCGVHSTAAVMNAYQGAAYVRGVYAYLGISNGDIADLQASNVSGYVTKSGNVFVDGQSKAVATNAITAGRQDIAGSNKVNSQGAIFFVRPPSVSFQQDSLPAFIAMQNGKFQFAIIASCGNPVKATATQSQNAISNAQVVSKPQAKPTAKPAPAPAPAAPAQVQAQSQSQSQTVNVNNSNTTTVENNTPEQPAPAQPTAQTSVAQPAAQPASLVNTGPAGVVGVFVVSSVAGAFGFRRFLARRLAND
jgi:hypothetical protein